LNYPVIFRDKNYDPMRPLYKMGIRGILIFPFGKGGLEGEFF